MLFTLAPSANVNGTHKVGSVVISPRALRRLFGAPLDMSGDGKVTGEFVFRSFSGAVFTLYDWKSSDRNLWDKEEPTALSIGGHSEPSAFLDWLTEAFRQGNEASFSSGEDGPSAAAKAPAKGDLLFVTAGKEKGRSGRVFWIGIDRYGKGLRLGLKDADGDTIWVGGDQVSAAKPDEAPAAAAAPSNVRSIRPKLDVFDAPTLAAAAKAAPSAGGETYADKLARLEKERSRK